MPLSPTTQREGWKPTIWKPQAGPQEAAIRAQFIPELFFGGARGPGKTSYLLGDFASDIQEYGSAWRGIIFRRTYPELDEVVEEGKKVLFGGFPGSEYKVGVHEFRIPHATGQVTLRLRHMESDGDADHYQGHSYTWVGFDELPNWPNMVPYHKLKACLRSASPIPFKRYRATGNPGGVGHMEVKKYFIDPFPDGGQIIQDGKSRMDRIFIKGRVTDNKILLKNDPHYIDRLHSVGDEELVRAWVEGDWNVALGAFFTHWHEEQIFVPSFEIPEEWPLFGSMDYGESAPTSFGLWTQDYDGHAYRICEYYEAGRAASTHAYEIRKMLASCPFTNGRLPDAIYADPSMWVKRRLHEVVNHSPADVFAEHELYLTPANNDRITGWRVINDLLVKKKVHCFDEWCPNSKEILPSLPRSKANPEDVDTKANDHVADDWRYGLVKMYGPADPLRPADRNPMLGQNLIQGLRSAHEELQLA